MSSSKKFNIYDCKSKSNDGSPFWARPNMDCIIHNRYLKWTHTPDLLISNKMMSIEEYFDAIGPKPAISRRPEPYTFHNGCGIHMIELNDTMGRIVIAGIRHSLVASCHDPSICNETTNCQCFNTHFEKWVLNEFRSGKPYDNMDSNVFPQEGLDRTIFRLLTFTQSIGNCYLFDRISFRQEYSKYVSAHKAHINSRLIEKIQKNDSDRIAKLELEIEQLKSEKNKEIESLTSQIKNLENKNQLLQNQITNDNYKINLIQSKLDAIERKYTPELIEYNYEEISARLDPIRSELKMAQRIFARIIRTHYEAPLAISVLPAKCA